MSTSGLDRIALASATRCRWPPDSAMPCSPILVSSPHGSWNAKPACAACSAASISSVVASAAPNVTFSRTEAENSVASSNPQATRCRSCGSGMSRTSRPASSTRPPDTSASLGTR